MTELFCAIAAFILSHAIPAIKSLRAALIRALGFKMYVTLYSMMSVGVLVWLGFAFANAPYVEVWEFREWTRWVTIVLMVPSCVLLMVGLFSPNPLSLSLKSADTFDASRPGIVGIIRHPVIWAIGLWALAHMPPNGDVAALSLFSLLLLAGLSGPKSLDSKRRSKLGDENWIALAQGKKSLRGLKIWPLISGLALYATLFHIHEGIIGVAPLPY
ncbi:MAG: NnrU family protein [Rhodospirillales bacterium]|nr:NnrU family protein [Rhodospirillales bacterium]